MNKRIAWHLLKGLANPDKSNLRQQLHRGLQAFNLPVALRGKYLLEIGDKPVENLDRTPDDSELAQAWKIVAGDEQAEMELFAAEMQLRWVKAEAKATDATAKARRAERIVTLLELKAESIPSLFKTHGIDDKGGVAELLFTRCEISQVVVHALQRIHTPPSPATPILNFLQSSICATSLSSPPIPATPQSLPHSIPNPCGG